MKLSPDNILQFLTDEKPQMTRFLEKLAFAESPSHVKDSQKNVQKILTDALKEMGFYVVHFPGRNTGGLLYARPTNRKKNQPIQMLIGHCDTVWPLKTLDQMPVKVKDGNMRGPGVYDMKAGLTQIIFALKTLLKFNVEIGVTPVVMINSDEEIGSVESQTNIARIAAIANRAFVLEPALGISGKLKTQRKGIGEFTITVRGKAAHAGLDPGKGVNAIVELSMLVQQLYAMNDLENGISVNVGMIEGGIGANVVAPESKAVVDVRVPTTEDGKRIESEILGLSASRDDVEVEVTGAINRPPMVYTARNRQLWERAKIAGSKLGIELDEGMAGGASDGNLTTQFTATLDGLGAIGDGAHAMHEYMMLDKMAERTALLVMLLLDKPMKQQ